MKALMPRIVLLAATALASLGVGCGGGGSSSTTGNKNVVVTVTPSVSIIVLNATLQFAAGVTGATAGTIATTSGAVRAANIVTITTTAAHGLSTGNIVTISGVSDISFAGTFSITSVPSSTTFTYSQTGPDATSGGGTVGNLTVRWSVNDTEGGNSTVGTISTGGLYTAPARLPTPTTATISSVRRASSVVTITTTGDHGFLAGQVVVIAGVGDATFNGTFAIAAAPSTTTFTYAQSGSDATSTGGTASSVAVRVKATSQASSTATASAVVNLDSGVTVHVRPASATVGTNETLQFFSEVLGSSNVGVNWLVNDVAGGNSSVGTISANGLFTAPSTPPSSNTVNISSTGAVRASNVVTITTVSDHGFRVGQGVVIAGVSDASFNGNFTIASVPSTSTFTYAQTGANASSGGGTATSSSSTVTIKAVSVVDVSRFATAAAIVQTAADPTLTSIVPTRAAQGAVFQDLYLTGANFISTSIVRVNGTPLPSSAIFQASQTVLRARIPASLLATPGALSIDVQRQSGFTTPPQTLTVVSVRPAIVGATPDSGTQGGAAFSFNVNGGYFGSSASPVVSAEFAGNPSGATVNSTNEARQLGVTIGSQSLTTPGLFSVAVRNSSNPALFAATNLAVQPSSAPTLLGPPIPVGSQPSSIAINTATGVAVVTNRCSNSISRIDVSTLAPIGPAIPVGTYPTGVGVDEVRNLAVVANNGNNSGCTGAAGTPSLSIVNLATGAVSSTVTTNIAAAPFAVAVNPLTGLALVVNQSTNRADILDLTQTPPAIVSSSGISTGANPQVAVNPKLNWAVVTPGGAGTLSIVDLSRRVTAAIASTGGAVRANGQTTITTTAAHAYRQNDVVLVSGVGDASFNGIFTVSSVPSSTTFTYVQTGAPNASSSNGTVTSTPPVATVTIGTNVRGVAVNTFTQRAILADPTASGPVLFNLFDQVVSGITLGEVGATVVAFNSFTDIALSVNPNTSQASVLDPRTPARLGTVAVGAGPRAAVIDPGTNVALVVNETDGTVTPIGLGNIRPLHLAAISLPLNRQLAPGITLTSGTDLQVTLIGKGFDSSSVVRLNGAALAPPSSVSDRQIRVTIPAAMLSGSRRYVVDVRNSGGLLSNVLELAVAQAVDLTGAGVATCTAPAPAAVAIDAERDLALVTNSGCNNVSLVDMNTGAIVRTLDVQGNPRGVAVNSRLGRAVVTNSSSGSASLLDLTASPPTVTGNVTVASEPLGVAMIETTGQAIVANASSASLTLIDLVAGTAGSSVTVDVRPVAVDVDPARSIAVVAHATSNNVAVVNLASLTVSTRISISQLPSAVVFDPVTNLFVTNASLGNNLLLVNPETTQVSPVRSGINPTSLAYNHQSGTLVVLNSASNTLSVMDMVSLTIRDVISMSGSPQFAVQIHPRTNVAAIADQANNRLLLFPLPH